MKIKEFDIILDIKKTTEQERFKVVQGDSKSNLLRISLMDELESYDLSGANVEIIFKKDDGTTVQQTEETGISIINPQNGKFQAMLKTNTIACPGPVTAEVRILDEEIVLTTTRFNFYVGKSLLNDDTIESTDEFPVLTQLINDTKGIVESIPTIESKLEEITNTESNLNQSIAEGNTLKADLDTTIGEGNTLKTGLDSSITDGNVLKENLDDIIAGTDYEHVLTALNNKLDKTGDSKDNTVTFAEEDEELTSGSTHAKLFGVIKKKFADILTSLAGKIDKTSISNTTETNDPNKVAGTPITHGLATQITSLGNSIDTINNNLAWEEWQSAVLENGWTGNITYSKNKIGIIKIRLNCTAGTVAGLTRIASLPIGFRPVNIFNFSLVDASSATAGFNLYVHDNGDIIIALNSNFTSGSVYSGNILFFEL